jgi:Protein of unknown function (DUF1572)
MSTDTPILEACIAEFKSLKRMGEVALNQLDEAQFHVKINPLQNSVAAIVQHLSGNMISRWTDFLTSDGEKPGRDREAEFADKNLSRGGIMAAWEQGWKILFDALTPLTDADLNRIVTIRKEPHTVFKAINRQTAHYGTHVGQLLLIGKHLVGPNWKYATIPPGGTKAFNASKGL